jgi:hypothetical protein
MGKAIIEGVNLVMDVSFDRSEICREGVFARLRYPLGGASTRYSNRTLDAAAGSVTIDAWVDPKTNRVVNPKAKEIFIEKVIVDADGKVVRKKGADTTDAWQGHDGQVYVYRRIRGADGSVGTSRDYFSIGGAEIIGFAFKKMKRTYVSVTVEATSEYVDLLCNKYTLTDELITEIVKMFCENIKTAQDRLGSGRGMPRTDQPRPATNTGGPRPRTIKRRPAGLGHRRN